MRILPKTFPALTVSLLPTQLVADTDMTFIVSAVIEADAGNSSDVFVGDAAVDPSSGLTLQAGEKLHVSMEWPGSTLWLNKLYARALVPGQKLRVFCTYQDKSS